MKVLISIQICLEKCQSPTSQSPTTGSSPPATNPSVACPQVKSSVRTPPGKEPSEELPKVRIPATGSPGGHRPEKEFLKEEFLEEERPSSSSGPVRTPDFFGETLPDLRDRLGWTQVELAAFLGMTHSGPAVWESGRGDFREAVRAALLALRLAADLEQGPTLRWRSSAERASAPSAELPANFRCAGQLQTLEADA